jgi:hypothetical protein
LHLPAVLITGENSKQAILFFRIQAYCPGRDICSTYFLSK